MRRIALGALGPVAAVVLATAPVTPAHAAPHYGLDSAGGSVGTTHVTVSWNWNKKAAGYNIQVSPKSTFGTKVSSRTAHSDSSRPPGGRQAAVIGHLKDASYYWVRVRQISKSHQKAAWSAPFKVATKAGWPDPITAATTTPGPVPGSTTISWTSDGKLTDSFRIETALTPWAQNNSGDSTSQGWDQQVFTVPGNQRSLTLTPEQTAAAGAALGTGRHLFVRIFAVRAGAADSQVRGYAHIQSATIAGEASTQTGTPIRVASYNLRLAQLDAGTSHNWAVRAPLIAANLAAQQPTIAGLQELIPSMWDNEAGGIGLQAALRAVGMGGYALTRSTGYANGLVGDARILYDTSKLQLVTQCDPTKPTCGFVVPDVGGTQSVASYAQFRDLASGVRFWFVTAHLAHGNTADIDALRAQQVQTILSGLSQVNGEHLAVIFAADTNSYQTCPGRNAPHQALLDAGFYDTSAAATQVNMGYNTYNAMASPEVPSNNGFGARLDAILTTGMPGADRFEIVRTSGAYPSDHNMVTADLKLPAA